MEDRRVEYEIICHVQCGVPHKLPNGSIECHIMDIWVVFERHVDAWDGMADWWTPLLISGLALVAYSSYSFLQW